MESIYLNNESRSPVLMGADVVKGLYSLSVSKHVIIDKKI